MNGVLQSPTFLPACTLIEERQRLAAHDWAALAVAALNWAALAVAVLAFAATGAALWLGWK